MPNSSITLQELVDDASSLGDVSPALSTGGFAFAPALSIANDVMQAMINGGSGGQPYNWKWNRFNVTPFPVISYQQDYFIPGLISLGWIESAWASDINQTSIPKSKQQVEVKKDLEVNSFQFGQPAKLCWLPNDLLQTGTWGQYPLGPQNLSPISVGGFGLSFGMSFGIKSTVYVSNPGTYIGGSTAQSALGPNAGGLQNPGPYVVYTNPIGCLQTPINATTCITDPNGNLWTLTTFGTCGGTQPDWPVNPQYPTIQNPTQTATTVQDGTCVWTAINPKGQGFRLGSAPSQTGTVWQIQVEAQRKAPRFRNINQTLEPIPDDFEWAFKQGFFAECYRRNPDPRVRSKYTMERQLWVEALDKAVRQSDREEDDYGFYPGTSIMDGGWAAYTTNPANPFGSW